MEPTDPSDKAHEYVRQHLEPQQQEVREEPAILSNSDNTFLQNLLKERQSKTPFFTITGEFVPLDQDNFISSLVEKEEMKLAEEYGGEEHIPFKSLGRIAGLELGMKLRFEQNGGEVYSMQSYRVSGNDTIVDVVGLLPKDYTIAYSPKGIIERSVHDLDRKLVIINGDVTSIKGLLTLFHEIGHAHDLQDPERLVRLQEVQKSLALPRRSEMDKAIEKRGNKPEERDMVKAMYSIERNLSDEEIQLFLEAERNAWAFALQTTKTLLADREALEAASQYIHDYPLRMQSDQIRAKGYVFED